MVWPFHLSFGSAGPEYRNNIHLYLAYKYSRLHFQEVIGGGRRRGEFIFIKT